VPRAHEWNSAISAVAPLMLCGPLISGSTVKVNSSDAAQDSQMASNRSDHDVDTITTTPAALIAPATHAIELLARNQLDPRFARKLWKRLLNEAE
jgi:hypothetical protein